MSRVKMEYISREVFSILHELLMEKCYGEDALEAANWSDVELYGYNKTEIYKRKNSITQKIFEKTSMQLDGRILQKIVQAYRYPNEHKKIVISERLLKACLSFLEFDSMNDMEDHYYKKKKISKYEAPNDLKYSKGLIVPKNKEDHKNNNLHWLVNTNWYSYSLLQSRGDKSKKMVHQVSILIGAILPNGDCSIELKNNEPYTSFSGRIIKRYSTANVLSCELTSVDKEPEKRLYMFIHTSSDSTRKLYLGGFLRHTDGGNIYSGSFVMVQVQHTNLTEETTTFTFEEAIKRGVDGVILNFLYDKRLNTLKIPNGIYSKEDFLTFFERNKDKSGLRMPVYDLFIAAPIKGFLQQKKHFDNLKTDIITQIKNELSDLQPSTFESLDKKIDDTLKKYLYAFTKENEVVEFETFREKILQMIARLKEDDIGYKNIWYSAEEKEYSIDSKTDSSVLLMQDLYKFNLSKRFLLLLPNYMVSSVFLEAGWAMISEKNIPTFIVANREDLPFLLRKADTLPNRHIYISSWEEVGGIMGIPEWILHSGWHKI